MWFDGVSIIITKWGPDNIYIDMVPVYLGIIAGMLTAYLLNKRKK